MALKIYFRALSVIICILIIYLIHKQPDFIESLQNINIQFPSYSFLSNNEKQFSTKIRRFAIFSASIHSTLRSYIFYTPITAAAWQRIGYEVIVVFVGDFTTIKNNPSLSIQLNLTRTLLQRLGVHIINFSCEKSYSTKLSQLVRIFAGYIPDTIVNDRDYLLTTDSDIIPLHEQDYQLANNTAGFIYNAFCCGSFQRRQKIYHMYPMSHICLPKQIWRDLFLESIQRQELMKSNSAAPFDAILLSDKASYSFDLVSLYTRQEFRQLYDSDMKKGDSAWYMDQVYISMLVNDYCEKHSNIKLDKRHKGSPRLDPHLPAHVWKPERLKDFGDAHIIHDEIFDSHRWSTFKNLLYFLFNTQLANDFDFYYKQFTLTLHEKPDDH